MITDKTKAAIKHQSNNQSKKYLISWLRHNKKAHIDLISWATLFKKLIIAFIYFTKIPRQYFSTWSF